MAIRPLRQGRNLKAKLKIRNTNYLFRFFLKLLRSRLLVLLSSAMYSVEDAGCDIDVDANEEIGSELAVLCRSAERLGEDS